MRLLLCVCVVLYALALLQMSFFVHFFPAGLIPNFVMLSVLLVTLFERSESYMSLGAALFGGFLLDIFSGGIIGFWALVLLCVSIFVKIVLKDYVRFPIPKIF